MCFAARLHYAKQAWPTVLILLLLKGHRIDASRADGGD
jgi:hypothetical protein